MSVANVYLLHQFKAHVKPTKQLNERRELLFGRWCDLLGSECSGFLWFQGSRQKGKQLIMSVKNWRHLKQRWCTDRKNSVQLEAICHNDSYEVIWGFPTPAVTLNVQKWQKGWCGFWVISRLVSSPTAVRAIILRIQSLRTFIPSRAGLALQQGQLWDVGKDRMEELKQLPAGAG